MMDEDVKALLTLVMASFWLRNLSLIIYSVYLTMKNKNRKKALMHPSETKVYMFMSPDSA